MADIDVNSEYFQYCNDDDPPVKLSDLEGEGSQLFKNKLQELQKMIDKNFSYPGLGIANAAQSQAFTFSKDLHNFEDVSQYHTAVEEQFQLIKSSVDEKLTLHSRHHEGQADVTPVVQAMQHRLMAHYLQRCKDYTTVVFSDLRRLLVCAMYDLRACRCANGFTYGHPTDAVCKFAVGWQPDVSRHWRRASDRYQSRVCNTKISSFVSKEKKAETLLTQSINGTRSLELEPYSLAEHRSSSESVFCWPHVRAVIEMNAWSCCKCSKKQCWLIRRTFDSAVD